MEENRYGLDFSELEVKLIINALQFWFDQNQYFAGDVQVLKEKIKEETGLTGGRIK